MAVISYDIHRDLIERCKAGDRKAQFDLYSQYAKAMYNICMRMMRSKEEAEDVLQEAFTEVFTKLDTFRFESTIGAWIKRVVVNRCINALRKKRVVLDFEEDIGKYKVIDENESSEEEINYTVEKIHRAIQSLSDGYRVVLSLYLLEGYDHAEIAQIVGITESTSKSQYMRAKAKVNEWIKSQAS